VAFVRASFASALMFLAGAAIPLLGGVLMMFAPAPLLTYAAGSPYALYRISATIVLATSLVALSAGVAPALGYLAIFGLAAVSMCFMLQRKLSFELIVFCVTMLLVIAGGVTALLWAGSPEKLGQLIHYQLATAMARVEGFYKSLGVDMALTPETRAYILDTAKWLTPALSVMLFALMVLLNLAVLWRLGGKEQGLGYTLFGDLARWSAPEWLVWPLLVTGFGWFVPFQWLANIALDCFFCIMAVYLGQGFAIMAFYFKQLRMPAIARSLIYFVTVAQPFLAALTAIIGLFDLWFDFRRLKRPDAATRNVRNFL
jgi:uncharacterized protein YybS (DUF2232 family)